MWVKVLFGYIYRQRIIFFRSCKYENILEIYSVNQLGGYGLNGFDNERL